MSSLMSSSEIHDVILSWNPQVFIAVFNNKNSSPGSTLVSKKIKNSPLLMQIGIIESDGMFQFLS